MNIGKFKLYRLSVFLLKNFVSLISQRKKVFYFDSVANFGDQMNVMLCSSMSKEKLSYITSTEFLNIENYLCIGSVIQVANKNSIIWGSGFHFATSDFYYAKPKKVLAVRGPLTRQKLLDKGVSCPEIYGDPALLMPAILPFKDVKRYKVGIIPHYSNHNSKWVTQYLNNPDVLIINVKSDPATVVNHILTCEVILSSSLHGLILADAYGIPNVWIVFGRNIGIDNFKFHDYFHSVKREIIDPVDVTDQSLDTVLSSVYRGDFNFDPKPLLQACPFALKDEVKLKITAWYSQRN